MYYRKLDALRGLAACAIVLFHSPFQLGERPTALIHNAYLFVDLFFVLSGFVLSHRYGERLAAGMSVTDFARRRLARLYPLHAFLLFVFLFYGGLKQALHLAGFGPEPNFIANDPATFLSSLLLLQGLGLHDHLAWNVPSWSVSVEFFAYLIFALLLKGLDRGQGPWLAMAFSLSAYVALVLLGKESLDVTYDYALLRCLGGFYAGVALYRWQRRWATDTLRRPLLWEGAVTALVLLCVANAGAGLAWAFAAVAGFVAMLAVFTRANDGWLGKVLASAPLRALGAWSYAVYLVHFLWVTVFAAVAAHLLQVPPESVHGPAALLANLLLLAVVILSSRALYRRLEAPLRQRLLDRWRGAAAESAG